MRGTERLVHELRRKREQQQQPQPPREEVAVMREGGLLLLRRDGDEQSLDCWWDGRKRMGLHVAEETRRHPSSAQGNEHMTIKRRPESPSDRANAKDNKRR